MNPVLLVSRMYLIFLFAVNLLGVARPPLALPHPPSHLYTVNSTLDTPDIDPADRICADVNGKCSLRAAMMQANYTAGPDTIVLPAGTYQLTRVGHDISGITGSLMISDDVTIQGGGPVATIIDGNGAVIGDRVFWVQPTVKNVSLSGLTIQNGSAPTGNLKGGGLEWESSPTALPLAGLNLSDVILESNTAQYGGGLYMLAGRSQ